MAFLKHVGRHSGTGQRLSVVFLQLPDEKENALVVYSDSLPDRYHDSFMEAVESPEGQASQNLFEVLTRKVFWHGTPMLETLHKEGLLRKVPTSAVIMQPNSNTEVPLNDILAEMDGIEVVDTPVNDMTQTPEPSQVDANVEESKQDENRQIAQNLMIQAQLLEQDAVAKREEAYKYDPSLKPAEKKSKVRVTSGEDKPKRGRGRPRKNAEV
jgi:hypothetical protein